MYTSHIQRPSPSLALDLHRLTSTLMQHEPYLSLSLALDLHRLTSTLNAARALALYDRVHVCMFVFHSNHVPSDIRRIDGIRGGMLCSSIAAICCSDFDSRKMPPIMSISSISLNSTIWSHIQSADWCH